MKSDTKWRELTHGVDFSDRWLPYASRWANPRRSLAAGRKGVIGGIGPIDLGSALAPVSEVPLLWREEVGNLTWRISVPTSGFVSEDGAESGVLLVRCC